MKFKVGDYVKMIGWREGEGKSLEDQVFVGKIGVVVQVETPCYDYAVDLNAPNGKGTLWFEDELELV
jgi:hypothetical protein